MSITVRQALTIGGLQCSRLIAGEAGLDRPVACVDILEVHEPLLWIKENELLLTTCYSVRENPAGQLAILRAMANASSAALAIKFGRFIGQPPPAMLKLADEVALPLIDVPDSISFMEITHPLMTAIINCHAEQLEYSEKIHRRLTRLALETNGLAAITDELARSIGMAVAIYNESFSRLAASAVVAQLFADSASLDAAVRRALTTPPSGNSLYRAVTVKPLTTVVAGHICRIFPVEAQERRYGYILVIDHSDADQLSEVQNIAIEHGVTVAALQLIRDNAVYEARQSYQRGLLEDLIAGQLKNREVVISRCQAAGLTLDRPFIISVLVPDRLPGPLPERPDEYALAVRGFTYELQRLCRTVFSGWPAAVTIVPRGDDIIAIFPLAKRLSSRESRSRLAGLHQELHKQVGRRWPGVTVTLGISDAAGDVLQFSERYGAAKHVVSITRKIHGPGRTSFEEDMKIYTLLSGLGKSVEQFYQDVLGPIDNPRVKNRRELLQTLRVYLECQSNSGEAAEKLFIHRNTLRYRLNCLRRLLGRGWEEADYRFTLLTALKARELIFHEHNEQGEGI